MISTRKNSGTVLAVSRTPPSGCADNMIEVRARGLFWVKWLIAAVLLAISLSANTAQAQDRIISAPEASARLAGGDFTLLDIRTPEEWQASGVAAGAWPVSMHGPDFPETLGAILQHYRPEQIGLICATGGRSTHVINILKQNGIEGVANVSEGLFGNAAAPGWIARGLPVASDAQAEADFARARAGWAQN